MGSEAANAGAALYVVDAVLDRAPSYAEPAARRSLERELRAAAVAERSALEWEAPSWDEATGLLHVRCTAAVTKLAGLRDLVIGQLAAAARRVEPAQEVTIRVGSIGVVLAPAPSEHSYRERWGWYAVTLHVQSRAVQDDAQAPTYIDEVLRTFQRFRNASFGWNQAEGSGLFRVQVVARSPAGADGESRDVLENLIRAAIKEPDYSMSTVALDWLSEPEDPPAAWRDA